MRHILMLTAALALATGVAATADAQKLDKNGRCHDASGKFAKAAVCGGAGKVASAAPARAPAAPAAAVPAAAAAPKTAPAAAAMTAKRCKNDKGKFTKCSAPGAHPL